MAGKKYTTGDLMSDKEKREGGCPIRTQQMK